MWLFIEGQRGNAFLFSCVWGLAIGFLYDVFRMFRAVIKGGRLKLFFEDVLFCVMAAVLFALCCFNVSLGVMRMFMAVGALLGFFAYRFTLGLVTVRLIVWLKGLVLIPLIMLKNRCRHIFAVITIRLYTKRKIASASNQLKRI